MLKQRMKMKTLEDRINKAEKRQDSFEIKIDMYINKTDELIRVQREEMKEFRAKHDSDMARLESKIDNISRFVRNLTITAMVGVGASVAATLAIAYTAITALTNKAG